jgi:hypothetical protein
MQRIKKGDTVQVIGQSADSGGDRGEGSASQRLERDAGLHAVQQPDARQFPY